MKLLLQFVFLWLASFSIAQQEFAYTLSVFNNQGKPEPNLDVIFIETSTYERIALKTDLSGVLSYKFDHGKEWTVSVGDMRNCLSVKTGNGGEASRRMTYDVAAYLRENKIRPDRRTIQFAEINQNLPGTTKCGENDAAIILQLKDEKGTTYPGIEVALTCFESKTQYKTKTNAAGQAVFKVPLNTEFDIDIDGVESIQFVDTRARPTTITQTVTFQKRTFTETIKDGYILQSIPASAKPSFSHAQIKLKVTGGKNQGVREDVYVRMLKSNKVYKAKTDDNGDVTFMLPVRGKYLVDFDFQRDADVIDLSQMKGIGFQSKSIRYQPDPRLENIESFIPTVSNLILYDIQNFINKQYPEPTGDMDIYLNWGNKFNANSKEALLEVGFKTRTKSVRKGNVPLNVCFVVDKSGSMHGDDRIEQLKKSLLKFVNQLQANDIVSIVVFNQSATVAIPAQKVGDKKKILDVIHAIAADGGTYIKDALSLGFIEISKNLSPKMINRLVLLTDGYDSSVPEELVAEAKKYIQKGMELSAIGVGVDYNFALLSQLASAGGGLMHLAGDSQGIENAFQHELESILYPMAKNAKLEVLFDNQLVYKQLYGYTNEKVSLGRMELELNHLFPGLNQMALVKFDLINATKEVEQKPVVVRLTYQDLVNNKPIVIEKKTALEWSEATGFLDLSIEKEHKKVMAIAIVNQCLKVMADANGAKDLKAAESAARSALEQIKRLFPTAKPHEIEALVNRINEYVDVFETLKKMKSHN